MRPVVWPFAFVLFAILPSATTNAQISKGNLILLNRSLQIQGMVTKDDVFHLNTYSNANYTSINWIWDSGTLSGFPWSRWVNDETKMPPVGSEASYMSQLVSLQLGDEWNLNDTTVRTRAVNWFDAVRTNFPNTILYMNNFGGQVGDSQLADFITRARPDMLSFDAYPWKSTYSTNPASRIPIGGPPTSWYGDLRRYREHARGANIPLATYMQTFHAVQDYDQTVYRDPSSSELRLNHFGALAFNAKVLIDFTYNTGASSLFTSPGGDSNPTALLAEKTDIARRARNLGKALVRLKPIADAAGSAFTTGIMFIRGRNSAGTLNTVPIGFVADPQDNSYTDWVFQRNDPYLSGWAVTNKGTFDGGQRGDVMISWFTPLDEALDGYDHTNEVYMMVVNGLTDPAGSAAACLQEIRLNFQFPASLTSVVMLDPVSGQLQTNALPVVSGVRQLQLNLNGGDAALFKFADGAPFVGWGPPVMITSPAQGAIMANPTNLPITALAFDDNATATRIEFFVGDAKIGQDTSSPFSITWSNAVEGLYALTAVATYSNGKRGTSAPVSVQLQSSLISTGSVWKYLDNGSNQGINWRTMNSDDSTWPSGPAQLGYGDGDEATVVSFGANPDFKYITTYFRGRFNVADVSVFTNLLLRLLRDDGAVVYLNGTEVFRSNMPAGGIAYNTLASSAVGGADESTFYSAIIGTNRLVNGTNLLAVEVHQSGTNSSDISFDLELLGLRPILAPALSIRRTAGNAILSWSAYTQGFHLESSPALPPAGNWSSVTNPVFVANGQNTVAVNPESASAFFHLRKP